MASEDFARRDRRSIFPADCLHRTDCHSRFEYRRIRQTSQHLAGCARHSLEQRGLASN
jgi:hypothetical protein